METVTIKYETYKFEELTEEAQEKVLEKAREAKGQYDSEWIFECTLDDWKEKLESMGMDDVKIQFSGFWSQGDGASFNANVELKEFIKHANLPEGKYRHLIRLIEAEGMEASILTNHFGNHYSHENTRDLSLESNIWRRYTPRLFKLLKELENELEEFRSNLSLELYSDLEKAWDYAMSEECLREDIEAQENVYLEYGKVFLNR